MAGGFRILEDGSYRVAESLDKRITEQFVIASSSLVGGGVVTGVGNRVVNPSASLLSSASIVSLASRSVYGSASFNGTGVGSFTSRLLSVATSSLVGSGTLTPIGGLSLTTTSSLSGVATASFYGGFSATASCFLSGAGLVGLQETIYRNAQSSLVSSLAFYTVGTLIQQPVKTLISSGTLTATAFTTVSVHNTLSSVSLLYCSGSLIIKADITLLSTLVSTIYPIRITSGATLRVGTGSVMATASVLKLASLSLASSSLLNGNLELILSAVVENPPNRRILENGDIRITSDGNFRTVFGVKNIVVSALTSVPSIVPFSGSIAANKGSGYRAVTARLKHNGLWVIPKIYIKNNGTWKRVY